MKAKKLDEWDELGIPKAQFTTPIWDGIVDNTVGLWNLNQFCYDHPIELLGIELSNQHARLKGIQT